MPSDAGARVKRHGDVVAVNGLDLEVRRGECFGRLGPNGARKTTSIEILEGLMAPDAGDVEVLGKRWTTDPAWIRARLGIQLQETQLADSSSGWVRHRRWWPAWGSARDGVCGRRSGSIAGCCAPGVAAPVTTVHGVPSTAFRSRQFTEVPASEFSGQRSAPGGSRSSSTGFDSRQFTGSLTHLRAGTNGTP